MSENLQSESIDQLAAALVEFQHTLAGARKDSKNPFFGSKYADLESCIEAIRVPLRENGLAVTQTSRVGANGGTVLVTTLMHKSGQWIKGELPLLIAAKVGKDGKVTEPGPQEQGSAITYGRRYALAAITGLYQTDDDGEAAQGRKEVSTTQKTNMIKPGKPPDSGKPAKPIEGEEPATPSLLVNEEQMKDLTRQAEAHGWKPADVVAWIGNKFGIGPTELRQKYRVDQWQMTCAWVKSHKPGEQ